METYTIRNKTDLLACNALKYIEMIMSEGKVSGKDNDQYCYLTVFKGYTVNCKKNKGDSFTFTITKA